MTADRAKRAYLVRVAGPPLREFVLAPEKSPITLGRHQNCDLQTPTDEEQISRHHASFAFDAGRWFLTDVQSTWGTYLNGYRLPTDKPHVLSEGDLIRLTPWTFSFRYSPVSQASISSSDDAAHAMTMIRSIAPSATPAVSDPLAMLVEAVAATHQATDEATLAQLVVEIARRGTSHQLAAYLRPSDAAGQFEVIACTSAQADARYSRSLLLAAGNGQPAVLDSSSGPASHSIVALQIRTGLCIPLTLGQTIAAYLYLDSRTQAAGHRPNPKALDFALALARIASLALANIKRMEIEHRQAMLDVELAQAAAIQRHILPQRLHQFGPLTIIAESRPGHLLGGDFFDVIPLDDHRIAIVIGDVSGKGVAASVLMTTIHGFLHATLAAGTALDEAVRRLNTFIEPRRPDERFATMFAAIIDTQSRTLTYVDAAHGYGFLWDGASLSPLQAAGGPPLGMLAGESYNSAAVPFSPGHMLVAISDGIIEQPSAQSARDSRDDFAVGGVEQSLRAGGADEVASLFRALELHAGSRSLADDATIVVAKYQ